MIVITANNRRSEYRRNTCAVKEAILPHDIDWAELAKTAPWSVNA